MKTVSIKEIMERLGCSKIQVEMAEYSGYIPPSKDGVWDADKLEEYLVRWDAKLKKKAESML
jgi:hypothetical protein